MEEEDELQMKSLVQQRRENIVGGEASTDLESSIQSARGSGQSLDAGLQAKMGQAMGADFSAVKVHTDSQSDQLNQSIQSKAFTTGQDVFFRQGAYEPSSRGGQELIAHELTHVVQQNGEAVSKQPVMSVQRKAKVSKIEHQIGITDTVQREVTPSKSAESNEDVAVLQAHYNAAWDYLWASENAKKIYQFVHSLEKPTDIQVGASVSDAEVSSGIVRWNPDEKNVLLNRTQADIGVGNGGSVAEADIIGQSSAAVTLIHELGHIRQHSEAQKVFENTKKKFSSLSSTKVGDLVELIKVISDQAKNANVVDAMDASAKLKMMENDNVVRHERPTATDLGEARRNEYDSTMGNADEYENYFTASAWATVKTYGEITTSWLITGDNVELGVEKRNTALEHIKTQLENMKIQLPNITGWKKQKADVACEVVQSLYNELVQCEVEWDALVVSADLSKPHW